MASPSAPTWVETAARSNVFKNSATSRAVLLVLVCILSLSSFDVPQGRVDPGHAVHHRVRLEAEARRPFQASLLSDGPLDASGGVVQTLARLPGVFAREHAVKDRRLREIRAHADAGYRDEALNTRVREGGDLFAHDLLELRLHLAGARAHSDSSLTASRTPRAIPGPPAPRSSGGRGAPPRASPRQRSGRSRLARSPRSPAATRPGSSTPPPRRSCAAGGPSRTSPSGVCL